VLFKKALQKTRNLFKVEFVMSRKQVTSGASRSIRFLKSCMPIQFKHKKLAYVPKSGGGRNSSGRIVIRTKGHRSSKLRYVRFNPSFRDLRISFIAGFFTLPFINKLASLVFLSSGSATFIQTSVNHEILRLTKLKSIFFKRTYFFNKVSYVKPYIAIPESFFIIKNLPKNQPVSLLELLPNRGIQYARSTGVKAVITKIDTRTSISLVKLPSGVRKVFSIYSVGSPGTVALVANRKCSNNSAGLPKRYGKKSISRGVARNPVDHPHGGRAKSIKYQRSP
jgi:large subunit ribosomal protein L2